MVAPPLRRDRTPLAPAQPHKWLYTRNSSLGLTSALVKFFLFRVVKQTIAPFMSIEPFDLADPKPISGIDRFWISIIETSQKLQVWTSLLQVS